MRDDGGSTTGSARSAGSVERRRQAVLAAYAVLDEAHPSRPEIRSLVSLAAAACGVPMAAINLLTDDEQHQIETVGFVGGTSARSDSMCAVVIDDDAPVVLEDASLDPRFQANPWVTGDTGVRFYATFQLRSRDEVAVGTLCVFDDQPRSIDAAQSEALALLAARVVDVLDLELQGRELRQAYTQLEAANRRLSDFAATVSHDLRGPLGTVELSLGLLEEALASDEPSPMPLTGLVDRARRATGRMADTVEHLLRTANPLAVSLAEPVVWQEVVDAALEDVGPELERLEVQVVPSAVLLTGDPVSLRLVLQNLVTNAARHAGPTDPRVEVRVAHGTDAPEVHVVDHGPGVPAELREAIFERGERGNASSGGTGIGLATSRRLMTDMGGDLTVRDTPGGGATFVVALPQPSVLR